MQTISIAGQACHREGESVITDENAQLYTMYCTLPSASGLNQNIIAHYGDDGLLDSEPKPLVSYAPAQITNLECNDCNNTDAMSLGGCPREGSALLT